VSARRAVVAPRARLHLGDAMSGRRATPHELMTSAREARIAEWWPTINAMRVTDAEKAALLAQVADGRPEALFVVRALARCRDI